MTTREKWLKVRLSEAELNKLQQYSGSKNLSMSQVIRDYIKRLPPLKD